MRLLVVAFLLLTSVACNSKKEENNNKANEQKMENQRIQVIGNKFKVDFGGEFVFQLNFETDTQMTWAPLVGEDRTSNTEKITMTEIRPNVYMVYWKEKTGNTVTHVEDFENGIVYTNITLPDNTFLNFKGTLTLIK